MPNMRLSRDEDIHNPYGHGQIKDEDVHNHPDDSVQKDQHDYKLYHNEHTGRRVKVNGQTGTQIGVHPGSHKPYIKWDK